MKAVWSDESRLARWLEVELAATEAWAELGVVPKEAAEELRAHAVPPSPERVAEIEAQTQHDVAAFVDAVAEQAGPAARWLHYGLTSSDILDTALALQVREAGRLLVAGLDDALAATVRRAEEHRHTVMVGRTHGVHAEPITFGAKLATWAFELDRGRDRLARALEGMRVGKLSGTVGVYAGGDPEVERLVCERLGLEREPAATQVIPRDRLAELMTALALVAASLERFATEIRHLARTEVREVTEPFGRGQKGSSAMPHKKNPIVAERICGLARVVRADALVALENVALWHERDISHSSAERVVLPDAFLALDYMLGRFTWLMDGLVVNADRMRRNLEAAGGLVFSPRVLDALIASGLERDVAYRLVQAHALRAWEEELDFRTLVEADAEIAGRLAASTIAEAFDLGAVLANVDVIFERLVALAPKEEPVHA
jgi:adenylosuccinate lyase